MTIEFLPKAYRALIVGASGGIGLAFVRALLADPRCGEVHAACRQPDACAPLQALAAQHGGRLRLVVIDITAEPTIAQAAQTLRAAGSTLHLLINAVGLLHDGPELKPERRLEDLRADAMARSFAVNATGPILLARHFVGQLTHADSAVLATLSARVGSIADNRLGGWYAYRAAKAAQNQLTRTLAVEMARRAPRLTVLALHPGTVDTPLSRPFQARVPTDKLFDTDRAARQLLQVIGACTPADSGKFLAWDGAEIPW